MQWPTKIQDENVNNCPQSNTQKTNERAVRIIM